MAFYRKKLKWYHRLWNVLGYILGLFMLVFYVIVCAIPHYIISGGDKVCNFVENLFESLVFTDELF